MQKIIEDEIKLANAFSSITHECKCGHRVHIPHKVDFVYCSWCCRRVYRNAFIEFKRKLLRACGKDTNEQIS